MSTHDALHDDLQTPDETSQVIKLHCASAAHLPVMPVRQPAARSTAGSRGQETTVRFIEGEGGCSVLEVETSDRSGFVHGLSHALMQESVQIVQAEVKRVSGGVVDRFTIAEHDGSPIRAAKRLALQVAVLTAVDLAS